jgi:hypothetical protein
MSRPAMPQIQARLQVGTIPVEGLPWLAVSRCGRVRILCNQQDPLFGVAPNLRLPQDGVVIHTILESIPSNPTHHNQMLPWSY